MTSLCAARPCAFLPVATVRYGVPLDVRGGPTQGELATGPTIAWGETGRGGPLAANQGRPRARGAAFAGSSARGGRPHEPSIHAPPPPARTDGRRPQTDREEGRRGGGPNHGPNRRRWTCLFVLSWGIRYCHIFCVIRLARRWICALRFRFGGAGEFRLPVVVRLSSCFVDLL